MTIVPERVAGILGFLGTLYIWDRLVERYKKKINPKSGEPRATIADSISHTVIMAVFCIIPGAVLFDCIEIYKEFKDGMMILRLGSLSILGLITIHRLIARKIKQEEDEERKRKAKKKDKFNG